MRRKSSFALGAVSELDESSDIGSPMETVANLSDVMLVLAVALMLALIAKADIDFSALAVDSSDMDPVDVEFQSQDGEVDLTDSESGYEEVGTMIRDKETGELYILGG